jgi:hypothetical protein
MIVNDHNTLFNRDRYQALAAALDGRAAGTNAPASRGEPTLVCRAAHILFVGRELRLGVNRKDWIGAIDMEILKRPPDFGRYCVLSGDGIQRPTGNALTSRS